jgi:hypothetical protein
MSQIKQRVVGMYPLSVSATTEDGAPVTIEEPVTVTIYDGAGVKVVDGVPDIATGELTFNLNASDVPRLDLYSAVWTGSVAGQDQSWTTEFDLVGGYVVELADIRGYDRAFADLVKYPDDYVRDCRDQIEEQLEENGMCAFRPRGERETLSGNGMSDIVLRNTDVRAVYSIAIDGVPLTDSELASVRFLGNVLHRDMLPWPRGFANITVHYSYGFDRVPGPIRRAALILAKEHIVPSTSLPARATATTVGEMSYRITIAGRDGFTGIPDVDAAVNQFGRVRPVVG